MKKQKNINFCPKCGQALKADDHFCSKCGNKFSGISIGTGIGRNWKWVTVSAVDVTGLVTAVVFATSSNKSNALSWTSIHPKSLALLRHLIAVAVNVTRNWSIVIALPPKKPIDISPMLWSKTNILAGR